jgi:putative spermidine/putrescine transport system ATP-binding protein
MEGKPKNTPMQNWLELCKVSKEYDSRKILDEVNLSIMQGEIFTLLGPSGAGKSTLLKAIAGLVPIDSGTIRLRGHDITEVPTQERNVAMVFQDYSLFPSMSVRDNVAFPLVARRVRGLWTMIGWKLDQKDQRGVYREVDRVLELTRIQQHSRKRPEQLSGGEQQRVAIARALVFDPDLLCLDEPFSALDKNLRQDLQQEIRDLQHELGKTILYVTHDQTEALTVSSRLAILRDGAIQQIGTPQDVYERPTSAFTARFLGECNILEYIESDLGRDGPAVRTAAGTIVAVPTRPNSNRGLVGIRPEKFRVQSEAEAAYPFLKGSISQALFFGSQFKVCVRLESGEDVRVAVNGDRSRPLKVGMSVFLRYDRDDVILFPNAAGKLEPPSGSNEGVNL